MTPEERRDLVQAYRKLLSVQGRALRYFEEMSLDPALLKVYRDVLRYLRTRTDEQVLAMLRRPERDSESRAKAKGPLISDDAILELTLDQVREQVVNKETPRKTLERIAIIRFGATKSAVSSRVSLPALKEKLYVLIADEATHDSIERVASAKP